MGHRASGPATRGATTVLVLALLLSVARAKEGGGVRAFVPQALEAEYERLHGELLALPSQVRNHPRLACEVAEAAPLLDRLYAIVGESVAAFVREHPEATAGEAAARRPARPR